MREGVIKFQLDFQEGPAPADELLTELNAWRSIFLQLGLLGQDPRRYLGYGFGNLSRRLSGNAFLISGTQTGNLSDLLAGHYAEVLSCNPFSNSVTATGHVKPSSEALSHGILYQANPDISWVMHLHSPDIFNNSNELNLTTTSPDAEYGTPEMATEIEKAVSSADNDAGLIVMGGHEDGILAYGTSADNTGLLVLKTLALARS
jgi:ribulose-5-phosphate 4-epimerase/fuculose-1-phosphate aldolase